MTHTKLTPKSLAFCALFAALTGVCSQIAIPLPLIPINLALFSVYLAGGLLGPTLGPLSQFVYLLLGAVGLPVFSGFSGGAGVLLGPTGGYLWGYLAAAWAVGFLASRWGNSFWKLAGAMAVGLLLCYAFGTLWFLFLTGKGLAAALAVCVLPFLPGDAVKIVLASLIVRRLRLPLARIRG